IAVGVLPNMTGDEKTELALDVLSIALGNAPSPHARVLDWRLAASRFTPNPDAWAAFVGDYQSPQGTLRVYREQNQLHLSWRVRLRSGATQRNRLQLARRRDRVRRDDGRVPARPKRQHGVLPLWRAIRFETVNLATAPPARDVA